MVSNTSIYKAHFFLSSDFAPLSSMHKIPLSIEGLNEYKNNNVKKTYDLIRNIVWTCQRCGHTHIGAISTGICPICGGKLIERN